MVSDSNTDLKWVAHTISDPDPDSRNDSQRVAHAYSDPDPNSRNAHKLGWFSANSVVELLGGSMR